MPVVSTFEFPFLYAWGSNANAQLGLGTTSNRSSPVVVGSQDWVQMSVGGHALAIKSDGSLWGWGANSVGQLGLGHTSTPVTAPTKIGNSSWTAVATSAAGFSVALRADGRLFTWGANTDGYLGDGTVISKSSPVQIGTDTWLRIRSGFFHTLAIRSDSKLFAWGANNLNCIGDGTSTNRSSPVQIGALDWIQIGTAGTSSYGIQTNYSLHHWGYDVLIAVGTNTVPTAVPGASSLYEKVSGGNATVHAIATDGTLWGGGHNDVGQVGVGSFATRISPFTQVSTQQDWFDVQGHFRNTIALKADGRALAWGLNDVGQLGDGTTVTRNTPTPIAPSTRFKKLSISSIGGASFALSEYPSEFDCLPANTGFRAPFYLKWFERVGAWVGVGVDNPITLAPQIIRSTGNGAPWNDITPPASTFELYSVCDSGTHLVSTGAFQGAEATVIRSADGGLSWSRITPAPPVGNLFDVINEGVTGRLLAVGRRGAPSPTEIATVWSSDDHGATWTVRFTGAADADGYAAACVWDGTNWVVVGTPTGAPNPNAGKSLIMTSPDRITWTDRTAAGPSLGGSPASPLGTGAYLRIAAGDGKIVAVARPNFIVVSEDSGVTWTLAATIPGVLFSGQLFWSGTEWVLATTYNFYDTIDARGSGGAGVYYTSPDAVTWTPRHLHSRLAAFSGRGPVMGYRASNGETYMMGRQGAALRLGGPELPATAGLFSWGFNNVGQLAANSVTQRSSPVQVGSSEDWIKVGANNGTGIAIRAGGTLWTWGNSDTGLLGTGLTFPGQPYVSSPIQVGSGTDWAEVADGNPDQHMAAIRSGGTLWTWGTNNNGQLGDNTTNNRSSPVQTVAGGTNWSQVSIGGQYSAAIKTTGELWIWGLNSSGQLGDNTVTTRLSPVQLAGTIWKQISCGLQHTAAVKTDGTLWTWGTNGFGRLGHNDVVSKSSPVQVGALTDWDEVHCGVNHTLALKTDGTLWAVGGANNEGQLGVNSVAHQSSPIQIGVATDWIHVRAGLNQSAAIRAGGTLWTWGNNFNGGLGHNNGIFRSAPTQVGSLTGWQYVDCGATSSGGHMLALR